MSGVRGSDDCGGEIPGRMNEKALDEDAL